MKKAKELKKSITGGAQYHISPKGYRTVHCPLCGHSIRFKYAVEMIACGKCGYRK